LHIIGKHRALSCKVTCNFRLSLEIDRRLVAFVI